MENGNFKSAIMTVNTVVTWRCTGLVHASRPDKSLVGGHETGSGRTSRP